MLSDCLYTVAVEMVKASDTKAVQPGVDSAAAHKVLNFGATPPPSMAEETLHGTVNISKGRLVSLLIVAICVGNMLTRLHVNASFIYNTALKRNTVRSDSEEDELDEELIEDDTDFVDCECGDDDAVKPEPEPKAKLKGLANVIYGALYTGIAQRLINNDDRVWSNFNLGEMSQHLNCSELYARQQQTVHDQDAWKEMRRTYVRVVGADASTVGPTEMGYNGFCRPYYVDHSEAGRGIYAKDDVPQGSLVWHNIRTATFSEGAHFREFVMTLPREYGCDVLQWSYVTDGKIMCDLDEGSFCNNADDYRDANIDLDETLSAQFITKAAQLFATREIKKGEELVCNYAGFSDAELGSIRSLASLSS